MYVAKDISFSYKDRKVLFKVNMDIRPGRFVAVLGANGAGKSTLLKSLSGELSKYEGRVSISGVDIKAINERHLSLKRAVLPQFVRVHFAFTVEQIVLMGCIPHQQNHKQNEEVASYMLKKTGMEQYKNRVYNSLSGGEQQRVQLARVMAQISHHVYDEKYLLLDEPSSSLDMANQHLIFGLVRLLCEQGIGVMAIVHDLNLAVQYADDLIMLKNGKVVASGSVQEVISERTIEETYGHPVCILSDTNSGNPVIVPHCFRKNLKLNNTLNL